MPDMSKDVAWEAAHLPQSKDDYIFQRSSPALLNINPKPGDLVNRLMDQLKRLGPLQ